MASPDEIYQALQFLESLDLSAYPPERAQAIVDTVMALAQAGMSLPEILLQVQPLLQPPAYTSGVGGGSSPRRGGGGLLGKVGNIVEDVAGKAGNIAENVWDVSKYVVSPMPGLLPPPGIVEVALGLPSGILSGGSEPSGPQPSEQSSYVDVATAMRDIQNAMRILSVYARNPTIELSAQDRDTLARAYDLIQPGTAANRALMEELIRHPNPAIEVYIEQASKPLNAYFQGTFPRVGAEETVPRGTAVGAGVSQAPAPRRPDPNQLPHAGEIGYRFNSTTWAWEPVPPGVPAGQIGDIPFYLPNEEYIATGGSFYDLLRPLVTPLSPGESLATIEPTASGSIIWPDGSIRVAIRGREGDAATSTVMSITREMLEGRVPLPKALEEAGGEFFDQLQAAIKKNKEAREAWEAQQAEREAQQALLDQTAQLQAQVRALERELMRRDPRRYLQLKQASTLANAQANAQAGTQQQAPTTLPPAPQETPPEAPVIDRLLARMRPSNPRRLSF